jgi:hypothetical protein
MYPLLPFVNDVVGKGGRRARSGTEGSRISLEPNRLQGKKNERVSCSLLLAHGLCLSLRPPSYQRHCKEGETAATPAAEAHGRSHTVWV